MKPAPEGPGRKISECIAAARRREQELGYAPTPDAEFAADVQAAIDERGEEIAQRIDGALAQFESGEFFSADESPADMERRKKAWLDERKL